MLRRLRTPILAALASLALAALWTWPAVLDPGGALPGHPGNDIWNHAWGTWWVGREVAAGHGVPTHTRLLAHPHGGTLWYIDAFHAVLATPLVVLFGADVATTWIVVGSLAFSTWAAWLLVREVVREPRAAMVGAVALSGSAHVLAQAWNGITETLDTGFLALGTWALLRLWRHPTPRRGLALGLAVGACSLANFYYGLFAVLAAATWLLAMVAAGRRPPSWRGLAVGLAAGVAVAALVVLPVLGTLARTLSAPDALVGREPAFVWRSLLQHNYTDVLGLVTPGDYRSPDLLAEYGEHLLVVCYLGWVPLLLAAVALRGRAPAPRAPWVAVFLFFLVLALGPYLNVGGRYVEPGGRLVPLPFLALFDAFPIFSRISHPFRLVVGASVGLAVLAGMGAARLARGRTWGSLALLLLSQVEVLGLSPAPWPLARASTATPAVYEHLDGPGGVLDVPITLPNLERAVYLHHQQRHGRPVPWGLNEPMPAMLRRNPLTALLADLESGRVASLPWILPELELVVGARMLGDAGFGWVVLHRDLLPPVRRALVEDILTAVLGDPLPGVPGPALAFPLPLPPASWGDGTPRLDSPPPAGL